MKKYSQGWVIVGWAALALSAMVASVIAIYGAGEEGACAPPPVANGSSSTASTAPIPPSCPCPGMPGHGS